MKDEGHIYFPNQGIYFYTRLKGSRIPRIVAAALNSPQGRKAWGEGKSKSLLKIIFEEMIRFSPYNDLDFGIGNHMGGNDHDVCVVVTGKNQVYFGRPDSNTYYGEYPMFTNTNPATYGQFIKHVLGSPNDGRYNTHTATIRPTGWRGQPKRHRKAYYKGKKDKLKNGL